MESFTCTLPNGATAAGISCIPQTTAATPKSKPLIVGIHGGGYNSDYFHANDNHTAMIPSKAYGIPFVAVDRPCYGGTTAFDPMPSAANYAQETGIWLHRFILPALWTRFGSGCSGIVLLCHSLGCEGGIIAAAMHAQDDKPGYPLSGIIASGLGHQRPEHLNNAPRMEATWKEHYQLHDPKAKDSFMFNPAGTADPAIFAQSERLNHPIPVAEANSLPEVWCPRWRDWAAQVNVPVMFALVELECFFLGTKEHLDECVEAFTSSPRVDGSLVKGVTHCIELTYWSQGWYARCFGFAMECAVTQAVADETREA